MNNYILVLCLTALISGGAMADDLNLGLRSGKKMSVICDFAPATYGSVQFTFDLSKKSATVKNLTGGYLGEDNWMILKSFEKLGQGRVQNLDHFEMGAASKFRIPNLVMVGDNADDTDFLMTFSYQSCYMVDSRSVPPKCLGPGFLATVTEFADGGLDGSSSAESTKSCRLVSILD
ncbi:hypothetical protein WDW37_10255 [Bdellovibrionota bacterium FG-1]